MARIKITTSNDARVARVAAFPNGVIWYVYVKAASLYMQRSFGGVRGAEQLIIDSVVDWADVVHDAATSSAWLYFVTDEALWSIRVTDDLETPTLQAFNRKLGWAVSVRGAQGPPPTPTWALVPRTPLKFAVPSIDFPKSAQGSPPTPSWVGGSFERPTLILATTTDQAVRLLVVRQPVARAGLAYTEVHRAAPRTGGHTLWATVPSAGSNEEFAITVPASVGTIDSWTAVNHRRDGLESPPAHEVYDFPTGLTTSPAPQVFGGPPPTPTWSIVNRTPLKYALPADYRSFGVGNPPPPSWFINGIDVVK